jgi:hypothetical protein
MERLKEKSIHILQYKDNYFNLDENGQLEGDFLQKLGIILIYVSIQQRSLGSYFDV